MSLFKVPGWNVPANPTSQPSTSRKRKRPAAKDTDDHAAQKHIEKMVEALAALQRGETENGPSRSSRKSKSDKSKKRNSEVDVGATMKSQEGRGQGQSGKEGRKRKKGNTIPHKEKMREEAAPLSSSELADITSVKGNKRRKTQKQNPRQSADDRPGDGSTHEGASSLQMPATMSKSSTSPAQVAAKKQPPGKTGVKDGQDGLTVLQATMKKSLDGARFRWINEMLYKSDSAKAHELMGQDPAVFADYHTGFRHQVESWPTNPVAHYISVLSSYPAKTVIADLGCGDAALARALVPKGMTVLSYDLVSDGAYVIEADTCVHVPLPGSEGQHDESDVKGDGEGQIVDVVVCALSLMGTNWPRCIREAWRILRPRGELKIAEVTSRFVNVDDFVSFLSSFGFKLKDKDERNTHFTLFEFEKVSREMKSDEDWKKLLSRGGTLKPCEYKRR